MVRIHAPGAVILNVNDDEVSRYVVTTILQKDGFDLREASTGIEALLRARDEHPALIVLDVQLPDIDGLEVCRRLKRDARTAEIPVLQTSATFISAERKALGLESGADGYLVQPVEPLELLATVRALLRASAAERDVRAAASDWRQTFNTMVEGVAVAERDGVVTRANDAMRQLFGDTTLVGVPLPELLERLTAGKAGDLVEQVRSTGQRATRVLPVRDRWLDISLHPIATEGAGAGPRTLLIVTDVTPQRALVEQERRRAQELAEANNRKDQFLAMLAHELRNPLNAIATANALSGRLTATDERQARIRDTIARQTGHLSRLVEDLLEVSRLTRGRLQLQVRDVELVETLRHAVEASRTFVDARRHRLRLDLPAGPLRLRGDPLRLEQVFVNVINNAAKYSEPGSEIHVSCAVARGGEAVVRIRDQGVGIPQHYLEAVFDLFVQVDASLARTLGGIGIGLTLARGLVEQHGGRIRAESAGQGSGTEIIVTLPLAPAAAQEPRVPAGTPRARHDAGALTVLIVDDNADSVEMLRTLLETHQHTVHAAYDGLSGLQAALAVCPDVALIDIGLPGIDGYEVAAGIRASGQARDTHLVAVTGYGRPEDGARAIEAGFDHHLVKPVDFGDLERVLERVAARVVGERREMRDDERRRPEGRRPTPDAERQAPEAMRRTPDA